MSFDSSNALHLSPDVAHAQPKLPELARRLLVGLARSRPLAELCVELAIPASTGERIAAKLRRIGLLRPEPRERFSDEEEAFFASEVQLDPAEEEEERPGFWARARSLVR